MRELLLMSMVWWGLGECVVAETVPWLPAPSFYEYTTERPFPPERDPDWVLEAAEEFVVPAQGGERIRTFVISCEALGEPVFVEALRLSMGGKGVVRQAEIRSDATGKSRERDGRDVEAGFGGRPHYDSVRQPAELFAAWAPWAPVQSAPAGTVWRLHPALDLVVTCYVEPGGEETRIRPRLGIWTRKEGPERRLLTLRMANEAFKLAPGMEEASVRDRFDLPVGVRLHAVYPAGNRVASSFGLDVLGPRERDGQGELVPVEARRVLDIPEWRPYGQETYRVREPIDLEAGSRLELQIRFQRGEEDQAGSGEVVWGPGEEDEWAEVYVQLSAEGDMETLRLGNAISQHQLALGIEGNESRGVGDEDAHMALALMYADLGEHETATAHGESAVALMPGSGPAHAVLGAVHVSQGFFFSAQEHLEKAVRLSPESAFAWYNLGNVFYHYEMMDQARGALEKAEALDPRDYRVANNLGTIYLGDGEAEQARIRFERILRAQPYHAPAMANLARACQLLGRTEEAVRYYERAIELSPGMKDVLAPFLGQIKGRP